MQFSRDFPRILKKIWEEDPVQVPIQVSKLGVTYSYHCSTLRLSQVGAFTYVIPSAPIDEDCIICIDLVLIIVWVDSP